MPCGKEKNDDRNIPYCIKNNGSGFWIVSGT